MLRKILAVDDSALSHQMYKLFLSRYKSCKLVSAMNGLEALDKLGQEEGIDLILLDINMPVMNGLEFLQRVQKEAADKDIPVIIISTEGKEEDTIRGLKMGARGYVKKPFQASELHSLKELGAEMEPYGVTISKVTVTFAQPSAEVMQSLEARQLASVQQSEQAEKQTLAQRRPKDLEDLAHQEVLARIEREKEVLQLKIQEAKLRQQLVELEAEAEELKLAKLEQRLKDYPNAAKWIWEGEKLEVSRALAGNTRAVLQLGEANEILSAFTVREMLDEDRGDDES